MAGAAVLGAVAIGTTIYATHEQQKAAEESDAAMQAAMKKAEPPKLPDSQSLAASMAQADVQARTAGGTILSKPGSQTVGDGGGTQRKSLLGT